MSDADDAEYSRRGSFAERLMDLSDEQLRILFENVKHHGDVQRGVGNRLQDVYNELERRHGPKKAHSVRLPDGYTLAVYTDLGTELLLTLSDNGTHLHVQISDGLAATTEVFRSNKELR